MASIDQLLSGLKLPKEKYWQYATTKYKAGRDNITTEQLREQVALLTQCRQNQTKLDQFQKILADIANHLPTGSNVESGAQQRTTH